MSASTPSQPSVVSLPGGYHDILASRRTTAGDAIQTVTSPDTFDAHVRLSADEVERLQPDHLTSGIDDDAGGSDSPGPLVTGYTEWTAAGPRTLSMGWDWVVDPRGHTWPVARWQTLRTNLMLVGPDGRDLGVEPTRDAVAALMARIGWERVTALAAELAAPPTH